MNKILIFLSVYFLINSKLFAVNLLPHQIKPIKRLAESDQKGMLIYHSLGSGKTFLSLGLSEKYPNKKTYVILPRFLKSNWNIQIKQFGIKDPSRYILLSFEEATEKKQINFNNSIVVVDEVHKLISKVRDPNIQLREKYINLYFRIQQADKILALSGTPLFTDISDIAYNINLVSAKELLPFDKVRFKLEYTKIDTSKAWIRGYILESKWVATLLPIFSLALSLTFLPASVEIFGALGSMALFPFLNSVSPIKNTTFRTLNTEKIGELTKKYVSYYKVNFKEDDNYPRSNINYQHVGYSLEQLDYFLRYADLALKENEIKMILRETEKSPDSKQLKVGSTTIQNEFKNNPGNGREIGNFSFKENIPPKFEEILKKIRKTQGSVAVYSNYNENGIKLFAKFLNDSNYKGKFHLLRPDLKLEDQISMIKDYNEQKVKIILLHPEITEGVSLRGTEQLHILEPILNKPLLEQIIGRAVRYKSHVHLPKKRQHVDVFVWVNTVSYGPFPTRDEMVRRKHYLKYFSEVNENSWSKGYIEIDENYNRKNKSPDTVALEGMYRLEIEREAFDSLLEQNSL